jgi:uncharacterized protein YjiS (DUF1127 family)
MEIAMTSIALNPKSSRFNLSARLMNVMDTLELWLARHHQRKALAELDEHLRRDIGVSRQQAELESSKPFWR